MSYGLLKSAIGRACLAAVVVQAALVAHTASAWGQQRQAAPITFAVAPSGGPGAGGTSAGEVTWRYPDEPDVVYSASGAQRTTPAATPALEGLRVLDLRRSGPSAAVVSGPAAAPVERPEWLEQERVGPPYQEAGVWYAPTPEPGYSEEGALAVYVGAGGVTASGEAFDPNALTAAHPTLPIPSLIQVTDMTTGRDVIVRLNDRGPFSAGRLVALSPGAATALGAQDGAQVHVRYLGPAPRRLIEAADVEAPRLPFDAILIEEGPIAPTTPIAELPLPPNVGAGAARVQQTSFAPAAGGFTVQLGAFANLENAHALRARVRTAGVVSIEPVTTAQGELFRVRLGPFASESEAEAARAAAARLGVSGGVVRALP